MLWACSVGLRELNVPGLHFEPAGVPRLFSKPEMAQVCVEARGLKLNRSLEHRPEKDE